MAFYLRVTSARWILKTHENNVKKLRYLKNIFILIAVWEKKTRSFADIQAWRSLCFARKFFWTIEKNYEIHLAFFALRFNTIENLIECKFNFSFLMHFQTLLTEAISVQPKFLQLEMAVEAFKQEPCLSKEERIDVEKEAEELNVRHNLVVETCQTKKIQLVKDLYNTSCWIKIHPFLLFMLLKDYVHNTIVRMRFLFWRMKTVVHTIFLLIWFKTRPKYDVCRRVYSIAYARIRIVNNQSHSVNRP